MNNAVKFTPRNGRITIRSSNKGNQFAFEISDNGIGIEPERKASIFEPFHQGGRSITRRFGGLGLGLTISKTLIDLHGGTISVESAGRNKGTTFRVLLDLLQKPAAASGDKVTDVVTTSRKLRLLLVDDHADTRVVLSRLLSKNGHHVITADSAREALKILNGRRFDATDQRYWFTRNQRIRIGAGSEAMSVAERNCAFGTRDGRGRAAQRRSGIRSSPDETDQFSGATTGSREDLSVNALRGFAAFTLRDECHRAWRVAGM